MFICSIIVLNFKAPILVVGLVDIFCWLDIPRNRLFASFRTSICILEIKPEIKNRIMTHERAIVAARYLVRQKQVRLKHDGERTCLSRLLVDHPMAGDGCLSRRTCEFLVVGRTENETVQ